MKENIKTQIAVKGQEINVMRIDGKEYISLTDQLGMQIVKNLDYQSEIG